jgi:hypothetical protein
VAARTDRLPGQKVQEKQLTDLFNAAEGEFEKFISGPWFRDKTAGGDIVYFDAAAKKIVFSTGDVQEIFDWSNSYRTIYRSLYINCANESIPSITRQLVVSVQSLDTVELRVQGAEGSEGWNGLFKKLPSGVQSSLLASRKAKAGLWKGELAGLFRNDAGLEIYFSPPTYTLRENGVETRGGFVVYNLDSQVLELRIIQASGVPGETRIYKMVFLEEKKNRQTVRTLTLYPARVTFKGLDVLKNTALRLQQTVETEG